MLCRDKPVTVGLFIMFYEESQNSFSFLFDIPSKVSKICKMYVYPQDLDCTCQNKIRLK